MSRKQVATRPLPVSPSRPLPLSLSLSHGLMLAWFAALFGARWLIPTEGSAEGLTLWLVQLVLFTAVARAVWEWRFGEQQFRFDAIDAALGLLVAAQAISAVLVVFGVGNSRAAINVAWEWVGSAVLIGMLRQELTSLRVVRQLCLGLCLAAGVLAGFGLWQHYVGYGQMSREYDQLVSEHDRLAERLDGSGAAPATVSAADVRKLDSLRAEMARQQIPIEKDARQSLEQRLKKSTEPLGLFALTNSFAGLLIVMGLILVGLVGGGLGPRIVAVLLGATIAYCLVLTKSRSAYVGLCAGFGWWGLRLIVGRYGNATDSVRKTRWLRVGLWVLVGVCVVVATVGIASLSGGLDQAVLSEAPKSLRYRLEWWQATWITIREHIWFGTGPGNFRDYYLAHKLPESSEEIADPHNLVFDVWANAGTFGLIGLVACVGLMVRQVFSQHTQSVRIAENVEIVSGESAWTSAGVWGVGLAFPLSALGMELAGHGSDERLWLLGGIWLSLWLIGVVWIRACGTGALVSPELAGARLPIALESANFALLVHLLAAGGVAMPAITQLLWLVWVLRFACGPSLETAAPQKSPSESPSRGVLGGRIAASLCASIAGAVSLLCFWSGTVPELLCRTALQAGDFEWGQQRVESAQARYREAVEADRWAIEPVQRLADLSFQRWQQTQLDTDFESAVERLHVVCEQLPFASSPQRRLGQAWLARFERSQSADHARAAAAAFALAVERYPHHAALLSEMATASEGAGQGDQAGDAARRALQQDDINRKAGHSDKYLSTKTRQRMERLAGRDAEAPDAN